MPKFSDLLSENSYIPENNVELAVGMVIKAFVKDTKPPKEKRFIIMGISDDKLLLGTVFINSEININALTKYQQSIQFKLTKTDERSYIDHDSFIDCSNMVERDYSEIKNIVDNDKYALLGQLNEKDFMNIHMNISTAKTINNKLKEKYSLK